MDLGFKSAAGASDPASRPTRCDVVFLDRDGVIIEHVPYIRRADDVRLLPGAAAAIRRLNVLSIPVVIVTNQSGIGRGYFSEQDYHAVDDRMNALLGQAGAHVDLTYYCAHSPESGAPCECRKPGVALYRRALDNLGLTGERAAFVGDRVSDLQAAETIGGQTVMVLSPETPEHDADIARRGEFLVDSLSAAIERILGK